MRQNIILMMSLSGTIVVALYYVLNPLMTKYMTAVWRYRFLKMALLFYLFPFAEFKFIFFNLIEKVFGRRLSLMNEIPQVINRAQAILITADGRVSLPKIMRNLLVLLVLMACCTIIIITVKLYKYFRVKHILMHYESESEPPKNLKALFEELKTEQKVSGQTKLFMSSYLDTPFTLGLISPKVIIPRRLIDMDETDLRYVIKHELVHIKNKDLVYKSLGLLVMAIHWFNPVCILLLNELSNMAEICCDKQVVGGEDECVVKRYGLLLIELATDYGDDKSYKNILSIGFVSRNAKRMIRRIKEMKRRERMKKGFVLLTLVMVFTMALSTTIFAYETPVVLENEDTCHHSEWEEYIPDTGADSIDFSAFDNIFIEDKTGLVYNADELPSKALCMHEYEPGTKTSHYSNANGGCHVDYYHAKRCRYCGRIVIGDKYNTVTYEVCPHK